MNWIVTQTKWIMLVAGVLTCSMLYAALAPQAALQSMFGATLDGPLAEIVVRNWGALIALVGGMLIYAAYKPQNRQLVLVVAGLSKLIFIGLVLTYGQQFLGPQAMLSVAADLLMLIVFAICLVGLRRGAAAH